MATPNIFEQINKAVTGFVSTATTPKKKTVLTQPKNYLTGARPPLQEEIEKRMSLATPAAKAAPTNTITTPPPAAKPPVAAPKPTTAPITPPVASIAPPVAPPAATPTAPPTPAPMSDREALVEKLKAAMSAKSSFNPAERQAALEAEAGVPALRETTTKLREERTKTLTLLDNLEKDVMSRTDDFLVSDSERRRIEASERAPITSELGILDRNLGTAETSLNEESTRIASQITAEQSAAGQPLEDVKTELDARKTLEDIYGQDEEKLTTDMQEYNFAVSQGYTGSFMNYAHAKANMKDEKGTGGGAGNLKPGELSGVAKMVMADPSLLESLTPTERGKVLEEIAGSGESFSTQKQESINQLVSSALESIKDLEGMGGFSGAVGAKGPTSLFGLLNTPISGTDAANFLAKFDTLKAQITLPNLQFLRGLGAMSDREFATISASASALKRDLSEDQFKIELDNVKKGLEKAYAKIQSKTTGIRQLAENAGYDYDAMKADGLTDTQIKTAIGQ